MNAVAADSADAPAVVPERETIVELMEAGLAALVRSDDAAWRAHVDSLLRWRTQPLVQGLARLARELSEALGEAPVRGSGLSEACSRLEHVVTLTEEASVRTLDAIDHCRKLVGTLPVTDDASREAVAGLRTAFSEITAAQAFQDLTGQIIVRVLELVRTVDEGLGEMLGEDEHANHLRGHGPAVPGTDPAPATQDDANDLLASLGI